MLVFRKFPLYSKQMISIDTRKKYQMNWLSHNNKETRKTTITKDRITELQWLVRERQKIKHVSLSTLSTPQEI